MDIADALDPMMTFGHCPMMVLKYGMDGVRRIREADERSARRRELERLKKRKMVHIKKRGDQYWIKLTDEGQKQAFRLKILDADLFEDDRVTMVVFDIPESQQKLRARLRGFLSSAAFIPIQRSVWISPFDSGRLLAKFFSVQYDR